MGSDILEALDRIDSRELQNRLAKLERDRSTLIALLRALAQRDRNERRRRPSKKGGADATN